MLKHPKPPRNRALFGALLGANLLSWFWAAAAFHGHPALLGTALLAWVLGLRHAVDADHIAAIDNVVRKLMQAGARPDAVGFWFSLGIPQLSCSPAWPSAPRLSPCRDYSAWRKISAVSPAH